MEANEIMQYIDELMQGHSNKECTHILKEVLDECQARIEDCEKGIYTQSLQ